MADQTELDKLYREAQAALKVKEYDRAVGLLTQILVVDENYRDVSRLLANVVKLKRRRRYSHPALWGTLGVLLLLGLGYFFIPKVSSFYAAQTPTQMITATTPSSPIPSATGTATLLPTPTPIPLTWKRISMGLEFERDTVIAFATDKKDPEVIYAAMKNAGIYKTIDGGNSWFPSHNGMSNTQVESLLIDSQTPRILYATAGGIYKTEDGGENWNWIGDGTHLLIDPQDNSHLYAHYENGIYETTDQGNTWTPAYSLKQNCPDEIRSWAIHPKDGKILFIGGGEICAGVYQSSDSGRNWALIGLEDKPNISNLAIGLDEEGSFSIYAYFDSTPFVMQRKMAETGIYASYDGGANWSFTQQLGLRILNSAPDDPSTVYCAGARLFVKRGKGPWQQNPGTQSKTYTAAYIDHLNGIERIIAGATYVSTTNPYTGIFITTDGGVSWAERNVGIGSGRSELKIDPIDSARIYLAAYYLDYPGDYFYRCTLYGSSDSGKGWSPLRAASWCGPVFDKANTLYMNEIGSLQMSSDGGKTWLWGNHERGSDAYGLEWDGHVLPSYYGTQSSESENISANPYIEGLVYDVGDPIYYLTGSGWQKSNGSNGLSDARLFYTDQSKMIYAIDRHRQKYSTDNGKTWQDCGTDVTASRSDTRLALDLQGERLYLATPGQGVMVSTDQCGSWQPSNNGLMDLFVNTLAIDPNNPNTVYAGTDGGAYISYDSGATWGQVNDGLLGATVVYSIAVDKESNVYAATPYGVFKLENK